MGYAWELEWRHEKFWGEGWRQMEFRPPRQEVVLRHRWRTSTGLELRGSWVARSAYEVRGWTVEPWVAEPSLELNFELRQYFDRDRIQVWFAMLNPLSEDLQLHPAGAEDRFRALAGFRAQL